MTPTDKSFLEGSAAQYHTDIVRGWEKLYQKKRARLYATLRRHFQGNRVLELGCADGEMTQRLTSHFKSVTVVDGSQTFIDEASARLGAGNVTYVLSMFEDYAPEVHYDTIVMTHILEHLDDPVTLLSRARTWLAGDGKVLISVPNAKSLHRLVGVKMGMLSAPDSLNKQDETLGHKRVYTPELLRQHIAAAGLSIEKFGGIMLKPISNRQIEADWSDELVEAFFELGDDFPELCSEIYVVAGAGDN